MQTNIQVTLIGHFAQLSISYLCKITETNTFIFVFRADKVWDVRCVGVGGEGEGRTLLCTKPRPQNIAR